MRKIILTLAALAAIGIVMPYAAPAMADDVVIHKHRDHFMPPPPIAHHDHDRTVIIKHDHE